MGLTSALVGLAVVAGIGGLATSGPALAFPPAAPVSRTTSPAPSTTVGGAISPTPAGTPAGSSAAPRCDDGSWRGLDGINVEGKRAGDHTLMRFTMDINGHEDDPSRIALGANKQHPDSATFAVKRSVSRM